jgi:hypothetical protein
MPPVNSYLQRTLPRFPVTHIEHPAVRTIVDQGARRHLSLPSCLLLLPFFVDRRGGLAMCGTVVSAVLGFAARSHDASCGHFEAIYKREAANRKMMR